MDFWIEVLQGTISDLRDILVFAVVMYTTNVGYKRITASPYLVRQCTIR